MKRLISLLLALCVVTANACIGFASAEGTLTVSQTGTSGEYEVSYDVPEKYQIVIPATGTPGTNKSTVSMGVSGSASLAENEQLYVFISKPSNGFNMTGSKGTVEYSITSTCGEYAGFPENAIRVGYINGSFANNTFQTNLVFSVKDPSAALAGKYSQLITFTTTIK